MNPSKFAIGIDLGTSNCVVSIANLESEHIRLLKIEQSSAINETSQLEVLPSCLYFLNQAEIDSRSMQTKREIGDSLPFTSGTLAKQMASDQPHRVIVSAKSWLCNHLADRNAKILPWQADDSVQKISPLEATKAILDHLKSALESDPELKMEGCNLEFAPVVLTIPASFDEIARKLTVEAANAAGFTNLTLLEEPQAACYAWIHRHEKVWKNGLKAGDRILICDVGGGTTDLSLIDVGEDESGQLIFERFSVGDHLLLGGDNMDLALAYMLADKLEAKGIHLDDWQLRSLTQNVSLAKITLLDNEIDKDQVTLAVASKSASLFSNSVSVELTKDEVYDCLLEGFFPFCNFEEQPENDLDAQIGIQEYGLPFESDPAISKHIAHFLNRAIKADKRESGEVSLPNKVLFNGGVFSSVPVRSKILDQLQAWAKQLEQNVEIDELSATSLQTSVSRGAAYFAYLLAQSSKLKIRSGTSHSYYLGIEESRPAIPGRPRRTRGLCIVPQGMEAGTTYELDRPFALVTGKPSNFRFFKASTRPEDQVGEFFSENSEGFEELPNIKVTMNSENSEASIVPVKLNACLNEIGIVELWMKNTKTNEKWNLEYNLRKSEK